MTPQEAAFVKYGINSFLATKVLWFNQFNDIINKGGADYETIRKCMINGDPRVGFSHTLVPGPDGKRGFGGACFKKDVEAFIKYSEIIGAPLELLKVANKINNSVRQQYTLGDREIEQNINYNE